MPAPSESRDERPAPRLSETCWRLRRLPWRRRPQLLERRFADLMDRRDDRREDSCSPRRGLARRRRATAASALIALLSPRPSPASSRETSAGGLRAKKAAPPATRAVAHPGRRADSTAPARPSRGDSTANRCSSAEPSVRHAQAYLADRPHNGRRPARGCGRSKDDRRIPVAAASSALGGFSGGGEAAEGGHPFGCPPRVARGGGSGTLDEVVGSDCPARGLRGACSGVLSSGRTYFDAPGDAHPAQLSDPAPPSPTSSHRSR